MISSENPNCFEIITYSRVFYMSAVSQKLMLEWIHTIMMSSDLLKENCFFEQIEDAIETASIERSRLLIERSTSRVSTMMSSSPSRLTLTNKEVLGISPEGASIPQSPFKKISPVPASMSPPPQQQLSNKELLLQQHSAAQTRNRYLGLLQLRPKATPPSNTNPTSNGGNSTSPPPHPVPTSASLADFRTYQPKVPPSNALPSAVSQPEASMYGSSNSLLAASLPRSSSGFMYSPTMEHLSQSQTNIANNSPQSSSNELSFDGLERRRSSTFKDRTLGDDRIVNSDPVGRFTIQKPSANRKSFGSSLDGDAEPAPTRKGSLIGGYRSYDSLTSQQSSTPTTSVPPSAASIEL